MIVSWNWLKEYVALDMPVAQVEERLMMAGLNHESTEQVGSDTAIDLEVTSNRPDCLGHLGVAREIAVLFDRPLKIPAAALKAPGAAIGKDFAGVAVECTAECPAYTARLVRGVKVDPSPKWLVDRLATIGVASVNNVVDITNYVLFECGQPLHAFDLAKLKGKKIVVRMARAGEKLTAIDHKTYELSPSMCVIADGERPIAIAGVMGGADTEVTTATTDVLLESARFDPSSIRATARVLGLHSASSYRFERGLDPAGVDWASRRACELMCEIAGGTVAEGVVTVEQPAANRPAITLRIDRLTKVLGIEIPIERAREILKALGLAEQGATADSVTVLPPSWRADLDREIDLVEEVGRIHGYDAIPEDVRVPMAPSARSANDELLSRTRATLAACGFDEAMTLSLVEEEWSSAFSPWTQETPLATATPILRRADRLRRSLVPSLLGARRTNETLGAATIEIFEIAKVYLPSKELLPEEPHMIGLTSGQDFAGVKGAIEALLVSLHASAPLESRIYSSPLFTAGRGCELWLAGERFGFLGEVSKQALAQFGLRSASTVAEVRFDVLANQALLVPQYQPAPIYPAITRDLNFTLDESVCWNDLEAAVRKSAGASLEEVAYRDTYRDDARVGKGRKRTLLTIRLRSPDGTLTNQQADEVRAAIAAACQKQLGAELVAS